jgi:hypothetical protein
MWMYFTLPIRPAALPQMAARTLAAWLRGHGFPYSSTCVFSIASISSSSD